MISSELANVDTIALFGTSQAAPEQQKLTAGSLTATWEQGALRNICYDGVEVLRGIAFLSRDDAWGNNPAKFANLIRMERCWYDPELLEFGCDKYREPQQIEGQVRLQEPQMGQE